MENRHSYKGDENDITLSRFYNIRFLCYYNMKWYPFDVQTCSIVLKLKGKGGDFASLNTGLLNNNGRSEVNEYIIESTKIQSYPLEDGRVEIKVKMDRNLLTIVLTTIVPTLLLNIISYITNYFKPFFFEAIVTVNLTSMLVLTTLFINV